MKLLLLSLGIAAISCCSSKKTTSSGIANEKPVDLAGNAAQKSEADTVPACIKNLVATFKAEEKQNPPRKVYSYIYNEKTVYYVPAICCDFFSDLYDDKCNIIGHPDGGFTGKGDGKVPDFDRAKTNEKLIWADKRE